MSKKNKKSFFEKFFYNNKLLLLFSFVAAVSFGLYLSINNNPIATKTIEVPINLSTEETALGEKEYVPFGVELPATTQVVISGKIYIINSVVPGDIVVTPQLGEVTDPGPYELQLNPPTILSGETDYEIKSFFPQTIDVFYDKKVEVPFPLAVSAPKVSAQEGYILGDPKFTDAAEGSIVVTGPETIVNKISRAEATYPEEKVLAETETVEAEVKLYDTNNELIDIESNYLEIKNPTRNVTIPVLKEVQLPIAPKFINMPIYFEQHPELITTSVKSVLVRGETKDIVTATEAELAQIDFRNVVPTEGKYVTEVDIIYPQGVTPVDPANLKATVTIDLTAFTKKTVSVNKFEYLNLAPNLKCSASPVNSVEIMCLKTNSSKIKDTDIIGKIDLQNNLKTGEYELPTVLYSGTYPDVWGVSEVTTTVKIE